MLQYYFHVITPPPPPNFVLNGHYIYLFASILPHQVRLNENIYLLTQTTQDKQIQKDN